MRIQKAVFAIVLSLALGGARIASAQEGGGHGIGVGVEQNLAGMTGATFVYDTGPFRFDILFNMSFGANPGPADDATGFGIGGRFAYVLHRAGMADFSIGGGIGFQFQSAGDSEVNVQMEGFGQARVFLAPNFALLGSLGLAIVIADDARLTQPVGDPGGTTTAFGIGGQVLAIFGFTYYFR
jgi:hypothetical protein